MKIRIYKSESDVIFRPKKTTVTDKTVRGPEDVHKVLRHFKQYSGYGFGIRFYSSEIHDGTIYKASTEILSQDTPTATDKRAKLEKYLKRSKWHKISFTKAGSSFWKHKTLPYLTIMIGPTVISQRGVGFSVVAIGTDSEKYHKLLHKKTKPGKDVRINKIYDDMVDHGENPTIIRKSVASTK